jgi:hypothetical protein
MRWLLLAVIAAATAAGCKKGGDSGDADTEEDLVPDTTEDTTVPDTRPDTLLPDTIWDVPDIVEEEVIAICGNFEVEPGEDCDPPSIGTTCLTSCSTYGTGACTDECQAPGPEECDPPAEECDLRDDDCDGLVDEGTHAAWTDTITLAAGAGSSLLDLTWTGDGYAALWVAGSPADLHLAHVNAVGEIVTADTSLSLTAGDVAGRPALTWTGSRLMAGWTTSAQRHVAVIETSGAVTAHESVAGADIGPSPGIAWSGSHAALAWVESGEVQLVFVADDGSDLSTAIALTSGAAATDVSLDAGSTAVVTTWVDAGNVQRAVVDHAGTTLAAAAALTTAGGASRPFLSIEHGIAAWTSDHDGTARVYTAVLDTSWDLAGAAAAVADEDTLLLSATPSRLTLAAGLTVHALAADGTSEGSATLALDTATALAWGDLAAAAAGALGSDLALAFTGCTVHEGCDAWHPVVAALDTRTGHDPDARSLGHDAALEGSFSTRPVTYLSIQIYQDPPYRGPVASGIFTLTGQPYETCGLCVLVHEGCGTSSCERTYLAQSGTLHITDIGEVGGTFAGTLTGATLAEVTINSTTRESTWVEEGDEICLGSYTFDETIAGY